MPTTARWVCKLCIMTRGLKGRDLDQWPLVGDDAGIAKHLKDEHAITVAEYLDDTIPIPDMVSFEPAHPLLTAEEIEHAAKSLCAKSGVDNWDKISDRNREGYRLVVERMWEHIAKRRSEKKPEMVAVFMAWMGDDAAFEALIKAMQS